MAFVFDTTASRSALMKKIKSEGTKPEVLLRKTLWRLGYRYRLHVKNLPGKPDMVFTQQKVVVFIDGDFWHGKNWETKKPKIKANRDYWIPKIERTMRRDAANNQLLTQQGFSVLRFWTADIGKDLDGCVERVVDVLGSGPN